jgi:spore coat protein U-like protein
MLSTVSCFPLNVFAVSCSVTTTPVSFGAYNVYATTSPATTGQVTVSCNPASTPYTIALNGGLHGNISQRKLKQSGGTDNLLYNLYTDATMTTIWGDGTSSNGVTVASSNSTPLIVYGGMKPLQDINTGTYTDTVGITVTF